MNVYLGDNYIGCMTKDVLDGAEGDIHHIEIGCTGMPTIMRRVIHSISGAELCEQVKNLCVLVLLSCIFGDQVLRASGQEILNKWYNAFCNGNCPVCAGLCFHATNHISLIKVDIGREDTNQFRWSHPCVTI